MGIQRAAGDFPEVGVLAGAELAALRAISAHERVSMPFELARSLMVLGQVRRRVGHRRLARESLQEAAQIFESIGAPLWAKRASAELQRLGVRKAKAELSEMETKVAELAGLGLMNKEIAARLFISQRTVESNLTRAYRKLGIVSRTQLGALMGRQGHL